MLKGLLFDMDGVLTKTDRYHLAAWQRLATSIGIKLPANANEYLKGRSRLDSLNYILEQVPEAHYLNDQKDELCAKKNLLYQQLTTNMTPADILPGISTLLTDAKAQGLRLGVASASRNAPRLLAKLKLLDSFDAITDPTTLPAGKPDPAIYNQTAKLLGLNSDEVMSFEDAASGIKAITAAHQFAVGIGNTDELVGADVIVPNTASLDLATLKEQFADRFAHSFN